MLASGCFDARRVSSGKPFGVRHNEVIQFNDVDDRNRKGMAHADRASFTHKNSRPADPMIGFSDHGVRGRCSRRVRVAHPCRRSRLVCHPGRRDAYGHSGCITRMKNPICDRSGQRPASIVPARMMVSARNSTPPPLAIGADSLRRPLDGRAQTAGRANCDHAKRQHVTRRYARQEVCKALHFVGHQAADDDGPESLPERFRRQRVLQRIVGNHGEQRPGHRNRSERNRQQSKTSPGMAPPSWAPRQGSA